MLFRSGGVHLCYLWPYDNYTGLKVAMQEALRYNVGVARNVSRLLYGGGSHGHLIYTLSLSEDASSPT